MYYLSDIFPSLNVIIATVILLSLFAAITISGIRESSVVAVGIFIFHLTSILFLTGAISYYLFSNGISTFIENWHSPIVGGSVMGAIFLGFSASMLGISGFESSANFVEEQEAGVFPKTLKNMWIIVSVINPLMAFFALSIVPAADVKELYENTLLSHMAFISAGTWLQILISIDAVLVLSGAVLTSYIGVSGLLERMTLDRILPPFFLKKNKRGSSHRIILLFLALNVSVLFITEGRVEILAGVYTISFLSVMALFAIGNIYLKIRRAQLPRPVKASWISVILALIGVGVAIIGNLKMEPEEGMPSNFSIFMDYFIPTITLIIIMLNRISLLKFLMTLIHYFTDPFVRNIKNIDLSILKTIVKINSQEFVFFTKGDNVKNLNRVMLYILRNEHTKKVKVVTVLKEGETCHPTLKADLEFLNRVYPSIKIEFVKVQGKFSPQLIKDLSKEWNISPNFMFIGAPGNKFPYHIEDLGGVRLII
jgi:amino acid transporter